MKKKFLALALALALSLSLTVPSFAADNPAKEDAGIVGCYTMTRSGADAGQFVEKTLWIGYTGNDVWERIQGYNSIKADTTWTVTNTSKEENSYLNIFVMPHENEGDGETYSFSFSEELAVRRDGSFAYRHPMDGEPGPDEVELRNVYPGKSVTFSMADALECLGRDASEDMLYGLYIVQNHSDSKQSEEADYFYKLGTQSQEPAERPEKEDAGIEGCYTLTRQGTDAGQFVESPITLDFGGFSDEVETIKGYQPIAADTTWTVTNTSKVENSFLVISITFYEKFENEDSFTIGNHGYLRKDGSFVHGSDGYNDPEQVKLRHFYPGQSVTFSMADAIEYLGTDASENVLYCLDIVQNHSDSDKYEEADYYYKLGTQSPEPADPSAQYTDLVPSAWYMDAVNYVLTNNLFQGTSDTTFEPATPMSRAMFVVVLARKEGVDTSGEPWYEKGVNWARENGYLDSGLTDKQVQENIPRQEMALILYRHAGSPAVSGSLDGFTDADAVSAEARDAMIWAVDNGYIKGVEENGVTSLNPNGSSSRAEVATIFMRVFG